MGHSHVSSGRLHNLLLFLVERHIHVGEGRLVYCPVPLRCSANTAYPGNHPTRFR